MCAAIDVAPLRFGRDRPVLGLAWVSTLVYGKGWIFLQGIPCKRLRWKELTDFAAVGGGLFGNRRFLSSMPSMWPYNEPVGGLGDACHVPFVDSIAEAGWIWLCSGGERGPGSAS